MMIFLRNAGKSIYSPEFYRELLGVPLGRSWRYYFSMILMLSLAATAAFSFWQLPRLSAGQDSGWLSMPLPSWSEGGGRGGVEGIKEVASQHPLVLVVAFFVSLLLLGAFFLVYFLWVAAIVWWIARSRSLEVGYRKAYQLTLHASTLSFIVKFAGIVAAPQVDLYFLPTILLLLVISLNLKPQGRLASEP